MNHHVQAKGKYVVSLSLSLIRKRSRTPIFVVYIGGWTTRVTDWKPERQTKRQRHLFYFNARQHWVKGKYIIVKRHTIKRAEESSFFSTFQPTKYQLWNWKRSHLVIHAHKVKECMIIKVTYFLSCLQPLFDAGWICQLFCWPKTFVRPFALPLLAILHSFLKNKNKTNEPNYFLS